MRDVATVPHGEPVRVYAHDYRIAETIFDGYCSGWIVLRDHFNVNIHSRTFTVEDMDGHTLVSGDPEGDAAVGEPPERE